MLNLLLIIKHDKRNSYLLHDRDILVKKKKKSHRLNLFPSLVKTLLILHLI